MTNKQIAVFSYLDELYPDAHCELNYSKDYELLIAVMLSAQTTDKAVNNVTAILFSKYKSVEELANALLSDVEKIISSRIQLRICEDRHLQPRVFSSAVW